MGLDNKCGMIETEQVDNNNQEISPPQDFSTNVKFNVRPLSSSLLPFLDLFTISANHQDLVQAALEI